MALLTCRNVAFAYEGKVVASSIDLTLNEGDYLCIVGENGSGKSTLVKGMLGLMEPVHGKITYGDGLKRNEIGYLPQKNPLQRDFPASVWEVVSSGFAAKSLFLSSGQRKTAEENMRLMRIENIRKSSMMALSGGQQQRVLLARALCATRKLLLLDEPVAGLDPLATREMYELIDDLHQNHGVTIIMISHDVSAAARYATHILHLRHEPLFYGTAEDYAASELCRTFTGGDGDA
ncbi:MAG: metal ABC transporter ATP-binding protein [Eubacteriales bacterium]|nr:metal ABC transporter ATP-binding protein [Eubacteriales bacterium]